jgi:hypothetical protein
LYGSLTSADAAVGLVFEQSGRVNGGDCLKLTVRNLGETPLERWSIELAVPEPVRLTGATGFSPFGEGPVRLVPDVGVLGPLEAYSGTLCATPLVRPAGLSWRAAGPG